jgi:hypothetical protein
MKNLFNDISQDEKNRILEMHSGKKNVISEQLNHEGPGQECYRTGEFYLCVGDKGKYVKDLQVFLNSSQCCADCVSIKEDGIFGDKTKERLLQSGKSCFKGYNFIKHKRIKTGPNSEKMVPVNNVG